ncbi:MAG: NBR1-Ig-like domain-containing protein [Halorhodospira sp.]
MQTELEQYIRKTARARGLSLSEVARRAGMSRQALYDAWQPDHYPSMQTVVRIAEALAVHPLALLERLFQHAPADHHAHAPASARNGMDRSGFIRDENYPDGSEVLAGSRFRKGWTLQNLGDHPWVDRYLSCQDEAIQILDPRGQPRTIAPALIPEQQHVPLPRVDPDELVTVEVGFQAPEYPATVISYWKMTHADGTLCFPHAQGLSIKVRVITPIGAASQDLPTTES